MAQLDSFLTDEQIEESFPLLVIEESDLFDVFEDWDYPSEDDLCPVAEDEEPVIW